MRYIYDVANGVYSPQWDWEKPKNYTMELYKIMGIVSLLGIVIILADQALKSTGN